MKNTLITIIIFIFVIELLSLGCSTSEKKGETTMTNKDKAIAVLKALEKGDKTDIEKYISDEKYIQHNLLVPSGREALIGFLDQAKKSGVKIDIKRILTDGDFVATHNEYNFFGPKIGFDIFRFENGKIVEHWDNLQEKKDTTPSGHTMIDGPIEITDLDKTSANKALVKDFMETILINGKFDKLPNFCDGDKYIQHNPLVSDGLSGLNKAMQEWAKHGIYMKITTLHLLIGQGNFVLTVSEGSLADKPTCFYDLFRIENGKIAEHWDAIETIPPKDQWKNNNGKF